MTSIHLQMEDLVLRKWSQESYVPVKMHAETKWRQRVLSLHVLENGRLISYGLLSSAYPTAATKLMHYVNRHCSLKPCFLYLFLSVSVNS